MALAETRARVLSRLLYRPEAQSYRDLVDGAIRDAVVSIWSARDWVFATKSVTLDWPPDELGSDTNICSVTNGSRLVTFETVQDWLDMDATRRAEPGRSWIGQHFVVQDVVYTIVDVGISSDTIILDRPVRLDSVETALDYDAWEARWTWHYLPDDCARVLGVTVGYEGGQTTPRRLTMLDDLDAERMWLQPANGGNPLYYRFGGRMDLPGAGSLTATIASSASAVSDDYGFSGTTDRYVELAWSYALGPYLGPVSDSAVVQITSDQTSCRVDLSLLDVYGAAAAAADTPDYTAAPVPGPHETYRKIILHNSNIDPTTGVRLGEPCWRIVNRWSARTTQAYDDQSPLAVLDTDSTVSINQPHQISAMGQRIRTPDGLYEAVSMWPRPITATREQPSPGGLVPTEDRTRYVLRCQVRPPAPTEKTDPLGLPQEFEPIVVAWAQSILLDTHGDAQGAAGAMTSAMSQLKRVAGRYTVRADSNHVRGDWDSSIVRPWHIYTRVT